MNPQLKGSSRRHITRRELQVLELLTLGHGNPWIGEQLGISSYTVQRHLSTACNVLGVDNRTQLAMWYVREHGEVKTLTAELGDAKATISMLRRQLVHAERTKVKL